MSLSRIAAYASGRWVALATLVLVLGSLNPTPTFAFGGSPDVSNCSVSASSGFAFGAIDPINGDTSPPSSTITVTCGTYNSSCYSSCNATVTVSLNTGANSSSFTTRNMKSTSKGTLMQYNVYTNSSRTTVWGDGSSSTSTLTYTFSCSYNCNSGVSTTWTVYGKVPGAQYNLPPVADYSDSLTVTVSY